MDEKEQIAAELALGPLSDKETTRLTCSDDTDFAALRTTWEQSLAELAAPISADVPPTGVWTNIERRLGENNTALPHGIEAVPQGKGDWWRLADGVDVKSLYIDEEEDTESFLLRIQSGYVVEQHVHEGFTDECIVVDGDIMVGDVKFGIGDFHVAKSGSIHPPLSSEGGGILFVRSKRVTFDQPHTG